MTKTFAISYTVRSNLTGITFEAQGQVQASDRREAAKVAERFALAQDGFEPISVVVL